MIRRRRSNEEYRVIPFSSVSVRIPQDYLRKLYHADPVKGSPRYYEITWKDKAKVNLKLLEIERAENQLAHVKSIVEKIKLRWDKVA